MRSEYSERIIHILLKSFTTNRLHPSTKRVVIPHPSHHHLKPTFIHARAHPPVYTSNPSLRKHFKCASINALHFPSSSVPCSTTHSSLARFVSGHAQQIFFGFPSAPIGADDVAGLDPLAPMIDAWVRAE